jgi:hypothetical protein
MAFMCAGCGAAKIPRAFVAPDFTSGDYICARLISIAARRSQKLDSPAPAHSNQLDTTNKRLIAGMPI